MFSTQIARAATIEREASLPGLPLHQALTGLVGRFGRRARPTWRVASLPQFAGYRAEELDDLERQAELVVVPAGTVIETAGSRSSQAVFVTRGQVAVTNGDGVTIGRHGAGHHVVEAVLTGRPAALTVTAVTEIEAVVVHASAIRAAVRDLPGLTTALAVEPRPAGVELAPAAEVAPAALATLATLAA
jgi:hypothetical protein